MIVSRQGLPVSQDVFALKDICRAVHAKQDSAGKTKWEEGGIEMEALTAIQRRVFQYLFEYYLPLFTYRVCQAYFGTGDRRDIVCYPV